MLLLQATSQQTTLPLIECLDVYTFKHMARERFLVTLEDAHRGSCMSVVFYSYILLTSALRSASWNVLKENQSMGKSDGKQPVIPRCDKCCPKEAWLLRDQHMRKCASNPFVAVNSKKGDVSGGDGVYPCYQLERILCMPGTFILTAAHSLLTLPRTS